MVHGLQNRVLPTLPRQPSLYARRIKFLSDRIFGEIAKPVDTKTRNMVALWTQPPVDKSERFNLDYHPPHPMFHYLVQLLRQKGLYRDEHLDFNEELQRLRAKRGKGRPRIGEGKRALNRKQ